MLAGLNNLFATNLNVLLVGVALPAVVVLAAMVSVVLIMRRNRFNWYEQNLLEMSESYPEIIQCYNPRRQSTVSMASMPFMARQAIRVLDDDFPVESQERNQTRKLSMGLQSEFVVPKRYRQRQVPSVSCTDLTDQAILANTLKLKDCECGSSESCDHCGSARSSMFRIGLDPGQIDRNLYDFRQDSCTSTSRFCDDLIGLSGAVHLSVEHDPDLCLLRLGLIRAIDIRAKRTDSYPNPYFKVRLVKPGQPEKGNAFDFYQSKYCYETRQPDINEEFCFDGTSDEVSRSRIEIIIYDYDQFSSDERIGHCSIPLAAIALHQEEPVVFWAEILPEEEEEEESAGDILFRVAYLAKANRLTVTLSKGRNLSHDCQQPPVPMVRVTLSADGKRIKRHKATVRQATYNPIFNESLHFDIPTRVPMTSVVMDVTVFDNRGLFNRVPIGTLQMPLTQCKDLWKSLMSGQSDLGPARWYRLQPPQSTNANLAVPQGPHGNSSPSDDEN